jgi:N-acetylmuramic acid 6-phosphate etherase/N-acetylglucosamine-6-phosphate deacetylase
MIISAPRLFIEGAFTGPGAVAVENGVIIGVTMGALTDADVVLESGVLTPGLIDLHNNGAFGVDFATATPAEFASCLAGLASRGVTSVLPTIITAPLAALHDAAAKIAAAMALHPAILGLHLEGPFLAEARRGAHRADWLQIPDTEALDTLLADPRLRQVLRLITLAPELPGAGPAIRRLVAAGVIVSLGHTDATAAQMQVAADAGASMVTHVFNAQSALAHRAPGAPGIALTDPRLHPCLIADGLHVDPVILNLAFAACPRAIAVTDSILIAGLPAGAVKTFGGTPVHAGADGLGRRADGTIAGGGITLDEALRRLIAAGVPPETALVAATARPAAALGLADRGRIAPGARADLIWWDDAFNLQQVWTAGATAPAAAAAPGTEHALAELHDLETRPTIAIVRAFLEHERAAQMALAATAPRLAELAEAIAARLKAGGRLFYAGAGTSGRLALLDAVECGPTFGVPPGLIIAQLAGGDAAFLHAVEGAEDDAEAAVKTLAAQKFSAADALVGIAASGATPFTLAAIRHAASMGGLTGAIVNNPATPIAQAADIAIEINSGAEIIAGSTRLAAGTTQKIALNIISSTVMIRLNRTFGPYMVDLRASNAKLRRRAARIAAAIAGTSEAAAETALRSANFEVKTAILMLRLNVSPPEARRRLQAADQSLRAALATNESDGDAHAELHHPVGGDPEKLGR